MQVSTLCTRLLVTLTVAATPISRLGHCMPGTCDGSTSLILAKPTLRNLL